MKYMIDKLRKKSPLEIYSFIVIVKYEIKKRE